MLVNLQIAKLGIVKILQIICGFIVSLLLCGNWYGGKSCFYEGRIGFVSGLNVTFLACTIPIFLLLLLCWAVRFCGERVHSIFGIVYLFIDTIYAFIGLILFANALGLMIWFEVDDFNERIRGQMVTSTVFIGAQLIIAIVDLTILYGHVFKRRT